MSAAAPQRKPQAAAALVAAAACVAYAGSFRGVFQFDDLPAILDNPTVRRWWPLSGPLSPPAGALTVSGRPVLNLSFALNYAVSGYRIWSYHALNLAIHVGAALALFGLVRRTLARRGWPEATGVGLASALFWAVHPLTTQAVTYVAQRAESLGALLYLFALYAFARSLEGRATRGWQAASVLCCLVGMGAKEIMASAPVAVLLYDRTFAAGSWRAAWEQRRGYHLALASTWVPLVALVAANGWNRGDTAGFHVGVAWLPYWISQGEAYARYLWLAFWPHPLVFDYGPPSAPHALALALFAATCAGAIATAWAAWRGQPGAFLCAVALFILAPTSLIPGVLQFASEHRMYLPLAAVTTAVACAGAAVRRHWRTASRLPWWTVRPAAVVAVAALGCVTAARNRVYTSHLALWADTVAKRPLNPMAQANLGQALLDLHRRAEAAPHCLEAVRLDPNKPFARYNLGMVYEEEGRWKDALDQFVASAALNPKEYYAQFQAGRILDRLGRPAEAEGYLRAAISGEPRMADAYGSLGVAEAALGRPGEAIGSFRQSLALNPKQPEVEYDLGMALERVGLLADAASAYSEAARQKAGYWQAELNEGVAEAQLGRLGAARAALETAVRTQPDSAEAHANLAIVLDQLGHTPEAVAEYRTALRLKPQYADAHYNLGNALLREGRLSEARDEFAEAVRLRPDFQPAREMLARIEAALPP